MRVDFLGFVAAGLTLAGIANAQAAPSQSGEMTPMGATVPSAGALAPTPAEGKMRDLVQPGERGSVATTLNSPSRLPDLHTLPPGKPTLIGGKLEKLDHVRDQLTVRPFGGGRIKVLFDARTRIFLDGKPASAGDLTQGDRIYIDTVLDGATIFARSIRFNTDTPEGESQGAVVSYHPDRGELWVRDVLSQEPLRVRLTASTRLLLGERSVSAGELLPGTLVALKFVPGKDGHDTATKVSVLALPGASFTFAGQVIAVDLRTGLLVLTSATDRKNYEIHFDPTMVSADRFRLRQGADVSVLARFDGARYTAENVTINPASKP